MLRIRNSSVAGSKVSLLSPFLCEDSQKTRVFIKASSPKNSNRGQQSSCEYTVFFTWSDTWQQNHVLEKNYVLVSSGIILTIVDNTNKVWFVFESWHNWLLSNWSRLLNWKEL